MPRNLLGRSGRRWPSVRVASLGGTHLGSQEPAAPDVDAGHWHCMQNCGACCYLAPQDRPYLEDLLSPAEMETFREILGPDGWCRHYDAAGRSCSIYDTRPSFCRVKTWLSSKADQFEVDAANTAAFGNFCSSCCREHIGDLYGASSTEMARFNREVPDAAVEDAAVDAEEFPLPDGCREVSMEDDDYEDGEQVLEGAAPAGEQAPGNAGNDAAWQSDDWQADDWEDEWEVEDAGDPAERDE